MNNSKDYNHDLVDRRTYGEACKQASRYNQNELNQCAAWNQQHSQSDFMRIPRLKTADDILRERGL